MADGWTKDDEAQQRAWLALSPAQRLAWLEGMQRFSRAALRAAARRGVRIEEINDPCWIPASGNDD
jgi:hypothetical protein